MKKQHIANTLDQELIKKKKKYSNGFELNKNVCSEEKKPFIWQWNICNNVIVLFLLASDKRPILLR